MLNKKELIYLSISLLLFGGILYFSTNDNYKLKELFETIPKMKCFVINLDKNIYRWNLIKHAYPSTDLVDIPIDRFSAVIGKEVDIDVWLNKEGLAELKQVESDGYRTRHYQLTRGGIGCFLSHYTLAKQLIDDPHNEIYFILEDDAGLPKAPLKNIKEYLEISPNDWDIILFGTHRVLGLPLTNFIKVSAFWGTHGYIINKKGAKKLVDSVNLTKLDAQIDTYMAWMAQKGELNIYATKKHIIVLNNTSNQSDIQMQLIEKKNVDPYIYKGLSC